MNKIREIELQIQELRAKLYKAAERKSFTDPTVVAASQELDEMLLKYELFFKSKIREGK
ncbi:aspartyl-phosphate phosphatase Spo0E family protein [Dendrosporobacter sp. 1207_IL3150]|uniref:aspartyl-phosphate phosphatase Spo0E family protein n=1 Tax=Dendrosporobacter sp. 1207_IL3150 TaxID=3084054 RepID=UPI002FD91F3C